MSAQGSNLDLTPIWISLKTASITIVITFILGLLAAWWIYSRKSEALKMVFDGIFTLPMVLPPTVAGFFLLMIFGVNQPIGKFFMSAFGIRIAFSFSATVIAAVVISFPLMYRNARGAFDQVDTDLVYAARTLGMSEWNIFLKVLIPNALPGIISGGVLAFARGLGEFGATAMLAGNIIGKTRTLPVDEWRYGISCLLCVGDHWHLFYSCDFVESISIVCSKEKEFLNVGSTNI